VSGAGGAPVGEGFVLVADLSAAAVEAGAVIQAKHPNGTALCVGRHDGTIFVVKDSCPHAEFPLSEGTLYANGELECSWHGARFDCRTGAVLRGPAEEALVRYEVEERDGGIWVRRAR
jgi:3-phenylpropionate/trans-cinnamate dioxygenase ferredoxin subunit